MVAVNVDMMLTESKQELVSVVSDFLVTNDGSYLLPGKAMACWRLHLSFLRPWPTK